MNEFNIKELFTPIWEKIENRELKTVNNLRMILEDLGEKLDISTLNMLHLFREWLRVNNITLHTTYGEVTYTLVTE